MKYVLGKIKFIHIIAIALFEFVSLFLIEMVGINTSAFDPIVNAFGGIIVGFIGTLILVVLINILLDNHEIYLEEKKLSKSRLRKISVTASALYCSLFLFILFFIESFTFQLKSWNLLFGNAIVGFVTTPLSLAITFLIYNAVPYKIRFDGQTINKIRPIWSLVVISAVYECIALPSMAMLHTHFPKIFAEYLFILNDQITFGAVGLVSGILGGIAAMVVYNIFMKKSMYIECSNMKEPKAAEEKELISVKVLKNPRKKKANKGSEGKLKKEQIKGLTAKIRRVAKNGSKTKLKKKAKKGRHK